MRSTTADDATDYSHFSCNQRGGCQHSALDIFNLFFGENALSKVLCYIEPQHEWLRATRTGAVFRHEPTLNLSLNPKYLKHQIIPEGGVDLLQSPESEEAVEEEEKKEGEESPLGAVCIAPSAGSQSVLGIDIHHLTN